MFERHRAKKAAEAYQRALTEWQAQRDGYAGLLELAEAFHGASDAEIMLGADEALFYKVTGASLIEERRGRGTYKGASQGVSIPIGSVHGRSVRYRVGQTRGHYVQGTPTPTAIDTGTVFITNKRVIFQGAKQTRECLFAKLIGFQHADDEGSTTFSVSNRQKPTTIHYGPGLSANFDFRFALALAHYRNTVADLVAEVRGDLAKIDARRPAAPAGLPV
jgi:hypothetical protein